MKVIFIEDVPNIAEVGEVKDVADGYGRNYLLPHKLAVLAESQASYLVKSRLKLKAKREAQVVAEMQELASQLKGKELTIKAKVGEKGRLYGSITNADIAEALREIAGREIDKRKIEVADPIRQIGTHEVEVKLYKDVSTRIKLVVEGEEVVEEEAKESTPKKKVKAEKKKEADAPVAETEAAEEAEKTEDAEDKPKAKTPRKKKVTEPIVAEAEPEPPEEKAPGE